MEFFFQLFDLLSAGRYGGVALYLESFFFFYLFNYCSNESIVEGSVVLYCISCLIRVRIDAMRSLVFCSSFSIYQFSTINELCACIKEMS